ncbi:MAG: TolC family protein [Bacteroidales bacterium]|nr:TolC family protein [Bacteroidales bacterium]
MKNLAVTTVILAGMLFSQTAAYAQFKSKKTAEEAPKTETDLLLEKADSSETPVVITLEQALEIALSENVSVKVADMEIQRTGYAKKGAYAALFPQIDVVGSYQRTIKKQAMYMSMGEGQEPMKIEVGMFNTLNASASAALPLVSAQLWKSIKISGMDVELAVEKARSSRLETVTQVKNSYFAILFAKEAFEVYKSVYENAMDNFKEVQKKYDAQKVSEFELVRAKTTVEQAIPNVYNAESTVILALWQLKAVLGVDLDTNIDVAGNLSDYSQQMFYDIHQHDSVSLDNNSAMKQLAIQTEMLAETVKLQKYANIPTLAASFNFSYMSMANDVAFKNFPWIPYSTAGISLSIPIFAGGKRYQAIRQAKNQYEQVKLQADNTERQLMIAVRQNLNTMEMNMKSYYAAQNAVASAQKAYDIAEAAYRVGRSTLIELNDAQLALTQSRLAESQAIYNFVVAKAQLEQTIGQEISK